MEFLGFIWIFLWSVNHLKMAGAGQKFWLQLRNAGAPCVKVFRATLFPPARLFFWLDPDPELLFRIRIQQNIKEQIHKNVISLWILDFVYSRTVVWNWKWQIVNRFIFMIEFKVDFFTISK